MSAVARIDNLVVRYGRFTALNGFSCEVPEGATGLLGPNGAVFDGGTKCFRESFMLAFARWIERFSDRRSSEAVRG